MMLYITSSVVKSTNLMEAAEGEAKTVEWGKCVTTNPKLSWCGEFAGFAYVYTAVVMRDSSLKTKQ